eukprot:m.334527 g.334527  ORF g.334527 m.334527 type:complete len:773 (-) comp55669_c0_seq1:105-2423(-)
MQRRRGEERKELLQQPKQSNQLYSLFPIKPSTLTAIIVAVTVACYANSLNGEFVLDDRVSIVENKDVNPALSGWFDFLANDLWGADITSKGSHKSYRPLAVLSFRLNAFFHGFTTFGFHAVNVALQCYVSVLFARFAALVFGPANFQLTALASLLFATHPIHVECVANITGRAEIMSAMFALLAFFSYYEIIVDNDRSPKQHLKTVAFAALAMYSKESGLMMLPFAAAFHLIVHLNIRLPLTNLQAKLKSRPVRQAFASIGFLAFSFVLLFAIRMMIIGSGLPNFQPSDNPASFAESLLTRVLTYSYTYTFSAWLLIFPSCLVADWQATALPLVEGFDDTRVIFIIWFYVIFFALAALTAFSFDQLEPATAGATTAQPSAAKPARTVSSDLNAQQGVNRALPTGFLLAVISFLPASNIFLRVGFVVADRVLYLPSMGYCLLLPVLVHVIITRCGNHKAVVQALRAVLYIVLLLFVAKTVSRNADWHDSVALWKSGVEKNPLCSKCHGGYGYSLVQLEVPSVEDLALVHLRESIRLWPSKMPHNHIGNVLKNRGLEQEAEEHYKAGFEVDDSCEPCVYNLGNLYKKQGRYPESIANYKKAIKLVPNDAGTYVLLAESYNRGGDPESALEQYKMSLKLDPDQPTVHFEAFTILTQLGRSAEAKAHIKAADAIYKRRLEAHPRDPLTLHELGNLYRDADWATAESYFKQAIKAHSNPPSSYHGNLALHYARANEFKNAAHHYEIASRIDPNNHIVANNYRRMKESPNYQEWLANH